MGNAELKERVEELRQQGFKSPRLDALERKLVPRTHQEALSAIERELRQEMASSLGRAEEKLLFELLELEVLEQALTQAPSEQLVRAYNDRRERARAALYDYVVTREAVGLRSHELVHALYPIPPRR